MAGDSCDAMRGGESDITNWSIVLDCGEEATSRSLLPPMSPGVGAPRDLDPMLNEDFNDLRPPPGLLR